MRNLEITVSSMGYGSDDESAFLKRGAGGVSRRDTPGLRSAKPYGFIEKLPVSWLAYLNLNSERIGRGSVWSVRTHVSTDYLRRAGMPWEQTVYI